MRSFRPGMVAAIALGIYHSLGFMYTEIPFYLGDIITSPSSKEIILTRYGIVNLLVSLLPVFVFQVLFGSLLYKEFCSIGVYVFSRRVDRRGWFIRKAMQLFA